MNSFTEQRTIRRAVPCFPSAASFRRLPAFIRKDRRSAMCRQTRDISRRVRRLRLRLQRPQRPSQRQSLNRALRASLPPASPQGKPRRAAEFFWGRERRFRRQYRQTKTEKSLCRQARIREVRPRMSRLRQASTGRAARLTWRLCTRPRATGQALTRRQPLCRKPQPPRPA